MLSENEQSVYDFLMGLKHIDKMGEWIKETDTKYKSFFIHKEPYMGFLKRQFKIRFDPAEPRVPHRYYFLILFENDKPKRVRLFYSYDHFVKKVGSHNGIGLFPLLLQKHKASSFNYVN